MSGFSRDKAKAVPVRETAPQGQVTEQAASNEATQKQLQTEGTAIEGPDSFLAQGPVTASEELEEAGVEMDGQAVGSGGIGGAAGGGEGEGGEEDEEGGESQGEEQAVAEESAGGEGEGEGGGAPEAPAGAGGEGGGGEGGGAAGGGAAGGGSGGGGGGGAGGAVEDKGSREAERTAQTGVSEVPTVDMSGLDKELEASVEAHTGMDLAGHQAAADVALQGLFGGIEAAQAADVAAFESAASTLAATIRGEWAPKIAAAYDGAIAAIDAGYTTAKGDVEAAGVEQRAAILTAESEALATLATAETTANEELSAAVTAATGKVATFEAEWPTQFGQVGPDKADAFSTKATDAAESLRANTEAIVSVYGPGSGSALQQAQAEVKGIVARKAVVDGATRIQNEGPQRAAASLSTLDLGSGVTSFLTGLSAHIETQRTEGEVAISTALADASGKIDTDAREAETKVDTDVAAGVEQLESDRLAAHDTADTARGQLDADVETQAGDAEALMIETSADVADSYDSVSALIGASFDPAEFIDADSVQCFADEQNELLLDVQADHASRLTEATSSGKAAADTALEASLCALTDLGSASATEAGELGGEKVAAVTAIGEAFNGGLADVAGGVDEAATAAIAPLAEEFDAFTGEVVTELTGRLEAANSELDLLAENYGTELEAQVSGFAANINPESAAAGLLGKLQGVCRDAKSACHGGLFGLGTDENKLFNALRKIESAIQGNAVRELFPSIGGGSIDSMLRDDLEGNEYNAAVSYMGGNTAMGAQYELETQMRWYGDDEAQIETILRSLDETQRTELQAQDGWSEVATELQSNLDGTDIDVTDALLANQDARADAYRLRDDIDSARRDMNADSVHTALAGMDPGRREQIAQEFYAIQAGTVEAGDREPVVVDQQAAYESLIAFSTEERLIRAESVGPNGERIAEVRHGLDGANEDLASALILEGNDSISADVARFEVERTRQGGPKEANMETALYASEAERDAMRDPDSEGYAAAMEAQAERQAAFEERWQADYGSQDEDGPQSVEAALLDIYEDSDDVERGPEGNNREQQLHLDMFEDGQNSSRVMAGLVEMSADGLGTEDERLQRALVGATPEQVREADRLFFAATGETMRERMLGEEGGTAGEVHHQGAADEDWLSELSGDDARNFEMALLGDAKYHTGDEAQQAARAAEVDHRYQVGEDAGLMAQWEAGTMPAWVSVLPGVGPGLMGFDTIMGLDDAEAERVRASYGGLMQLLTEVGNGDPEAAFVDGAFQGTPEQLAEYEMLTGAVAATSELHREKQDAVANAVTTSIAVVGGVVATFFTGGLAAPMLVMALTGAATIGMNQAIKGGRYGWEAMAHDVGMTALEMVTFRGTEFLKGAKWLEAAVPDRALREVLIGGAEDFFKEGVKSAANDATWEESGGGFGEVSRMALRGGTSNLLKGGLGTQMGPGDSRTGWTRALMGGGSKAVEEGAGSLYETGFDAATTGRTTEMSDAALQALSSAGQGSIKGTLNGGHFSHKPSNAAGADAVLAQRVQDYESESERVSAAAQASDERLAGPMRELGAEHEASLQSGGEGIDPARAQAAIDGAEAELRPQYIESVESMQTRIDAAQEAMDESIRLRQNGPEAEETQMGPRPETEGAETTTVRPAGVEQGNGSGPSDAELARIRMLSPDQRAELLSAIDAGADPRLVMSRIADDALLDRLVELETSGAVTQADIDYVLEPNSDGARAGRLFVIEQNLQDAADGDGGS